MQEPKAVPAIGVAVTALALTVLGVLSAARMYITYAALGHPISVFDALGTGLVDWYLWAPLIPVMVSLARRIPFTRSNLPVAIAMHGFSAAACSFLQLFAFAAYSSIVRTYRYGSDSLVAELRSGFTFKFSTGVLVYLAFVWAWQFRQSSLRAAALTRSLADARLRALESQLRPHFLFNTLNTIADLVRHDTVRAERAVLDLGELMRAALRRDGDHEVSLREELALLAPYLRIQSARFGDRLAIETRVEPETLDAMLPALLLQPLVENAIQHGTAAVGDGGLVSISAARCGDRLALLVQDGGTGRPRAKSADERSGGFGLASTRERLRLLYGDAQAVVATQQAGGGTLVRIELPLRARRTPS